MKKIKKKQTYLHNTSKNVKLIIIPFADSDVTMNRFLKNEHRFQNFSVTRHATI